MHETLEQRIDGDRDLTGEAKVLLHRNKSEAWFVYAFNRFGAGRVATILNSWKASAAPFVDPGEKGFCNAQERELVKKDRMAALYANTPKHAPTRQQRRYAAQKGIALT